MACWVFTVTGGLRYPVLLSGGPDWLSRTAGRLCPDMWLWIALRMSHW